MRLKHERNPSDVHGMLGYKAGRQRRRDTACQVHSAEFVCSTLVGRQLLGYTEPPDSGFQLRDGAVLFSMRGDGEAWDKFFIALDRMDLAADPRFAVGNLLVINRDLEAALRDDLKRWSVEAFRRLIQDELGGTITVLQTLQSVMHSEQTAAIGAVQTVDHPVCGRMPTLSPPWKFSEPLTALRRPAPLRGQHSDEILREHGYVQGDIATLRAQRVVA